MCLHRAGRVAPHARGSTSSAKPPRNARRRRALDRCDRQSPRNPLPLFAASTIPLTHRGRVRVGPVVHRHPLLSGRGKAIPSWGHNWVVVGVIVRFSRWPDRPFCLPILFRLYPNKQEAAKQRRRYRPRPELAVEMLHRLCRHRKLRRFHAVADSAYGGQRVLCHLPSNCDLASRLGLIARLYGPAPAPSRGRRGRPRRRGDRLPTPEAMLAERCRRVTLDIYGRTEQARVSDRVARVYAAPEQPLRVVAVEALRGGRGREVFYSTAADATAEDVIQWYAWRWSEEVTFHDAKQQLGFEDPQGWTRQAVEHTAPVAMLLYSLIVLWFVREGHRHYRESPLPWYRSKARPSFRDMLVTLRRASVRQQVLSLGLSGPGSRTPLTAPRDAVAAVL